MQNRQVAERYSLLRVNHNSRSTFRAVHRPDNGTVGPANRVI